MTTIAAITHPMIAAVLFFAFGVPVTLPPPPSSGFCVAVGTLGSDGAGLVAFPLGAFAVVGFRVTGSTVVTLALDGLMIVVFLVTATTVVTCELGDVTCELGDVTCELDDVTTSVWGRGVAGGFGAVGVPLVGAVQRMTPGQ
jgi:hypothetical protein